jgi:hypothetical protein
LVPERRRGHAALSRPQPGSIELAFGSRIMLLYPSSDSDALNSSRGVKDRLPPGSFTTSRKSWLFPLALHIEPRRRQQGLRRNQSMLAPRQAPEIELRLRRVMPVALMSAMGR